jgi:signal peptidase I
MMTTSERESKRSKGPILGALALSWNILTGRKRKHSSTFAEYAEALAVAVVLALFIRTFFFQAFQIPSGSMEDTLLVGDYLFVNKFLYGAEIPFTGGKRLPGLRDPRRGDIIVFRYPKTEKEDYIKRCVGVEGDTILYMDKVLYVNGERIVEDFTKLDGRSSNQGPQNHFGPFVVPKDHLFMMGDNRDHSSDSRFWGPVNKRLLRGKAIFIYWSWDNVRNRVRFGRLFDLIH